MDMNSEEKILNMTKLIEDLSKENELLKEENQALKFTLDMYDKKYKDNLDVANDIIDKCSKSKEEYMTAINEAHNAKKEYDEALRDMYLLKKKYQKEMKQFIDMI